MNESNQIGASTSQEDEIDVRELFSVLWAGKWIIIGITSLVAIAAVVIVLMLPNVYRAEALFAPKQLDAPGGLSGLAAQYGGLASLAGINLTNNGSDKTALGLEILRSRQFISEFVDRHNLLVPLIAAQGWDASAGELIVDSEKYDVAASQWVREVSPPKQAKPSLQEAYLEFRKILSVSQDSKTGFVTVSIEHYSPAMAKQWVDLLIEDLNASIMRIDVLEAEQAIKYLEKQIANTSLVDFRNVFFKLIEEQTKTVMLASVTDEYLLKTIDPAVQPELKTKPRRSLIVIVSVLLAGLVAVTAVLTLNSMREDSVV